MTGVIKKINAEKGYGFITVDGGTYLFFHTSQCNGNFDSLREGDKVTFESQPSDKPGKGPNAVNVAIAE